MGYRVVLLGPPASGKGTQAKALSTTLRVPHVSTGQLFRDAVRRQDDDGSRIREFIDRGELVPDETTIAVVDHWLQKRGRRPEFILDGFPRTLVQAVAFDRMLAERELDLPVMVFIQISEEETLARIMGRLGCTNCGNLYHVRFSPPRQAGRCDQCGKPLEQRDDDNAATVRERLRQYRTSTLPVVAHYRDRGELREIDGQLGKQQVFNALLELVRG